jgi:hypothetical protein
MARSKYIYLLQHNDGEIMGAWTVKHEMVTELERMDTGLYQFRRDYRVSRMKDGGSTTTLIPWEDLL